MCRWAPRMPVTGHDNRHSASVNKYSPETKKRRIPDSGILRLSSALQLRQTGYCCAPQRLYLPKLSNSPLCTPPMKACHSSEVNRRTAPSRSLLLRTPMLPSTRSATSTQLPLAKLKELLTHLAAESGRSGELSSVGVPTFLLH